METKTRTTASGRVVSALLAALAGTLPSLHHHWRRLCSKDSCPSHTPRFLGVMGREKMPQGTRLTNRLRNGRWRNWCRDFAKPTAIQRCRSRRCLLFTCKNWPQNASGAKKKRESGTCD
ncbi:hypothetical protein CFAM422_002378 [Trichoderma lentiforme]|uniref:Uncharacterized protein n=1 Tax=Trichoderma lentiforme TaxID=1567552 RepID=A0A9P4XM42_9HYPO|nr:hypothetical protein CFAM422_002378 [Trichoderma lentiforme]